MTDQPPQYHASIVADDTHTYAVLQWADAEAVMVLALCRKAGDDPWEVYAARRSDLAELNDGQRAALDDALARWEKILSEAEARGG